MSIISYLCKERWEGRDKIISMMSFIPTACTSDFNRTYCSWDRYFLLILQMTLYTQSGILLSDPLRGDLNLSALVCLPGSAICLSCPCCKIVWMQASPCSQQGFVLAYWCWHPSIFLPTSPHFDGCSILTYTGGFSLKVSLSRSCVNWRIPNRSTLPSGLCILSWRDCLWDKAVNIH